jgi:hypothetical protein
MEKAPWNWPERPRRSLELLVMAEVVDLGRELLRC